MTDPSSTRPILLIGGTGKTGQRVAERLTALGHQVRIGSRRAPIPFDWHDRATWPAALTGARAAYIAYYPDLAAPGAGDDIRALVGLALQHGVRRLVLLSGRGEEEAQACEKILASSDAEWTIVRAGWFNQNFSENFLIDDVLRGEVRLPSGDVPEPFVDADDIADVAAAALSDPAHIGKLYELTGPRLLTLKQAVAEIAAATGRPIRFVDVSADAYAALLRDQGVPADFAALLLYLFTNVLDGRNASLADGVRQALGRAPRDFADYARDTARTGVWNPK